jgi:hypothetical protein
LVATRRQSPRLTADEKTLGFYGLSFGKQPGCESLSFTDSLDLDCGRFDDLFDASYSRQELRISAGTERLSLASALSKEIGTRKGARENTNARNESDKLTTF